MPLTIRIYERRKIIKKGWNHNEKEFFKLAQSGRDPCA